jgi:uncharacterized protein YihD (DUF1040 family)
VRDPKRIETVLSILRAIWLKNPDLRLGQIVVTAARPEQPCPEVFSIEDEVLLQGLSEYAKRIDAA